MTEHPPHGASLQVWLQWLEQQDPQRIELGLERVAAVYSYLPALDRDKTRVATIAGTNGKGTAVATLESLALAGELETIAYTSPHIEHFTERVRLKGVEVEEQQLVPALERVAMAMDRADVALTYFEYTTLAALTLAADCAPDLLILEVGLGGRLDAVNLIDPDICLLTSVALDHQAWLGHDRSLIAREKLGICRPGVPLICSEIDPPEEIFSQSSRSGFPLTLINRDFHLEVDVEGHSRLIYEGTPFCLPRAIGLHPDSVSCALVAALKLGIVDRDSDTAHLEIDLPGRFEWIELGKGRLILDVAHNPAAWQLLADRLRLHGTHVDLLVAVMADKDYASLFALLDPQVRNYNLLSLPLARAASVEDLLAAAGEAGIDSSRLLRPSPEELTALLETGTDIPLLATGSFYTVAFIKQLLRGS